MDKRKPYDQLSVRQKKRRISSLDAGQDNKNLGATPNRSRCNLVISPNIQDQQNDTDSVSSVSIHENCIYENSFNNHDTNFDSDTDSNSCFMVHTSFDQQSTDLNCVPSEIEAESSKYYHYKKHISTELKNILSSWIKSEKTVSHFSVDRLLKNLRENNFDVPLSTKTLMKDVTCPDITPMDNGEYFHCNEWVDNIRKYVKYKGFTGDKLNFLVNIDGLSLFNPLGVSKYLMYPILVKLFEIPDKIFCVGSYCSNNRSSKSMPSPNIILKKFLNEVSNLIETGIFIEGDSIIRVHLKAFICDAPMRSTLKGIINHTGYNSCERCTVHGEHHGNTVVFLENNCIQRTDLSFKNRVHEGHHKVVAPNMLEQFGFLMVSGFFLDEMHLCFLGVMKRILSRLLNSKIAEKKVLLPSNNKVEFNRKLELFQEYIPVEFNRKLEGGLECILKWKASQFRLFALYIGMVLFHSRRIVSREIYNNFLKFSVALRILNMEKQNENMEFVRYLLRCFTSEASNIYGNSFLSYNVHSLIHLPDDYEVAGNLNEISAFSFESYLGSEIKNAVRAGYKPLAQIAKHVNYTNSLLDNSSLEQYPDKTSKCTTYVNGGSCLKILKRKNFTLRVGYDADCYIMLKSGCIGKVLSIKIIDGDSILKLKTCTKTDFFKNPICSSQIGIFIIELSDEEIMVNSDQILSKLLVLPFKRKLISVPMLHSLK